MALSTQTMNSAAIIQPTPKKMMKRKTPGSKTARSSSKRLRFSEFSSLVLTEPRNSQDRANSWYTKEDIAQMKMVNRLTALKFHDTRTAKCMKYIARGAANQTPQPVLNVRGKEVIRGIEHFISPEVMKYIVEKRRKAIASVLEEQELQKMGGKEVTDLRQVSEMHTSFSKEWCSRITAFQHEEA